MVTSRRKKEQKEAIEGKDGKMRSKTSGTKPICTQMQWKGINGDTMLRPSSSSGLTTAEKEEEAVARSAANSYRLIDIHRLPKTKQKLLQKNGTS